MNLLIVNDVELTIEYLVNKIEWSKIGIQAVYSAYNSIDARKILSTNTIDIILCDIEMPGENGIDLIRWVQNEKISCDTVFLTCHANFEYLHQALHLDCLDYILFPSAPDRILQAVSKAMERRVEKLKSNTLKNYGEQWIQIHTSRISEDTNPVQSTDDIISNTIRYIMDHISSPELSVNEIADKNFLSIGYLSRIFKKSKGISISQFIIKRRMELAARLLTEDNFTVSNISLEVGYNNYPYFTATFKKYYNCTPSEYRSQKKKE